MPRKQKNPVKVAEGLAKGLTQMQAVVEAGYAPSTAQKNAYAIVKRPLVQSALTEALERQGVTLEQILHPVVDALDATLVARTLAGLRKTTLPDHRIRLEGHDRLVRLYGGTPRPSEIPPLPPKGLTVIIRKEGEAEKHESLNLLPKTKIEPQGQANPRPLPYRITRESED